MVIFTTGEDILYGGGFFKASVQEGKNRLGQNIEALLTAVKTGLAPMTWDLLELLAHNNRQSIL